MTRTFTEGYARYEVDKIYFAPDEVDIHVQAERNSYPLIDMSLSEILDQDENILNLEEKERAKSLIFYNCKKLDEELVTCMTEKNVSESAIEITRTNRIGRERDNDLPKPPVMCI